MKRLLFLLPVLAATFASADEVLLEDHFDRADADPAVEAPGNGWGTNSKTRAKGVKQVWIKDDAMYVKMADVADHAVSVTQDVKFKDAVIEMRFKLGPKDDLGVDIADMSEKSVHAGHICAPRVRLNSLEISDLKTGRMNLELNEKAKAKTLNEEEKKLLATKSKKFPLKLKADEWHDLKITIEGDTMTVSIDGKEAGSFASEGIGHPTKNRIRLGVGHEAWVDDVKITTAG